MFFVSKKDVLYFIIMWCTTAIAFLSAITSFIYASSIFHFLWGLPGLVITGFFIWLWFGTGYKVENDTVKIHHGPFKQTVKVRDIKRISKKKSVWSAAALATDRLVIQYGKYNWDILVSPKEEYEFIKLLITKNPQIQIDKKLSEMYKLGRLGKFHL